MPTREVAMKHTLIIILAALPLLFTGCDEAGDESAAEDAPPQVGEARVIGEGEDFEPRPLLDNPSLVWQYAVEGATPGLEHYTSGRLYCALTGVGLFCLDGETGDLVWESPEFGAPVFDEEAVYLHRYPGDGPGNLICRDLETGDKRWNYAPSYQYRYNMVSLGGKLYLGVDMAMDVAGTEADQRLLTIDKATGEQVDQLAVQLNPSEPFYLMSVGDALYMRTRELRRLNPESLGSLWGHRLPGNGLIDHAYDGESLYLLIGDHLERLDPDEGASQKLLKLPTRSGKLLYASGHLYAAGERPDTGQSQLTCLAVEDDSIRWAMAFPGQIGAPVYLDGAVYVVVTTEHSGDWGYVDPLLEQYRDAGQDIELTNLVFSVYALDAAEGELLWRLDADFPLGELLAADGKLFLSAEGGRVFRLDPALM
ncbi:MAG: PQQ-binding-like beta-propeller repeat protein [Candidatus Coatesbacteria bacterium]|nr:PQQ-binding-like beta-propeller repeat protein [Candidatus Coatesbacteria bacterium]